MCVYVCVCVCMCVCVCVCVCVFVSHLLILTRAPIHSYGVATISRLLKSIGLFCKRAL